MLPLSVTTKVAVVTSLLILQCTLVIIPIIKMINTDKLQQLPPDFTMPTSKSSFGDEDNSKTNHQNKSSCVSIDAIDELIATMKAIFIIMPAKAAGSSIKYFIKRCTNQSYPDNFMNNEKFYPHFLMSSLKLPPIIASHSYSDELLIHTIQHATKSSLIVYIHREETDRLLSSIRHVVNSGICNPKYPYFDGAKRNETLVSRNATTCVVREKSLVYAIIKERVHEIGIGTSNILTCNSYDAIQENAPNLLVLHYKQVNELQKRIAKYHCPTKQEVLHINTKDSPTFETLVALESTNTMVNLEEWLIQKQELLEWSLHLKKHSTCQAKTRKLETSMLTCPSEAIML